jgi:hypothetical protein
MKKLALVMAFVFSAAMIAPAFAADPVKKEPAKTTTCAKEAKGCSAECAKACGNKEAVPTAKKTTTSAPAAKK